MHCFFSFKIHAFSARPLLLLCSKPPTSFIWIIQVFPLVFVVLPVPTTAILLHFNFRTAATAILVRGKIFHSIISFETFHYLLNSLLKKTEILTIVYKALYDFPLNYVSDFISYLSPQSLLAVLPFGALQGHTPFSETFLWASCIVHSLYSFGSLLKCKISEHQSPFLSFEKLHLLNMAILLPPSNNYTIQCCSVVWINKWNELGLFLDLEIEATWLPEALSAWCD